MHRNHSVLLFQDPQPLSSPATSSSNLPALLSQLTEINRKILQLQIHQQSLQDKLGVLQDRVKCPEKKEGKCLTEVFMFLEQKLAELVGESERAIQEIKAEVERVLTREVIGRRMKGMEAGEDVGKVERVYAHRMKLAQDAFDAELTTITRSNTSIQQAFQTRLGQIEYKMGSKIKEMAVNQQRLKQKIKEQEQQIRNLTQNLKAKNNITQKLDSTPQTLSVSQKAVDISAIKQTRPHLVDVKAIKEPIVDENQKDGHSRIRRNRIFDKRGAKSQRQNQISPIKNNGYSELNSLKILNQDLDKFEDFKQNQFDGSDQDVFFYPQNNKQKEFVALLVASPQSSLLVNQYKASQQQASSKHIVFSPFDLS